MLRYNRRLKYVTHLGTNIHFTCTILRYTLLFSVRATDRSVLALVFCG